MKYTFSTRNRGTRQKPAWQLIISYEQDGKWKQKSKGGFASKAEAMSETAKKNLISKINVTTDKDLLNLTVGEFLEIYVQDKHLSESSYRGYRSTANVLKIADKKLTDVTYADLKHGFSNFPYKDSTKNIKITVIKAIFTAAKKYKIISTDPAENLKKIKIRTKDSLNVLTEFELQSLLSRVRNELQFSDYLQIAICAKTGMRVSEMLGLTNDCIDLENHEIKINKQVGLEKGGHTLTPCKTHNSNRTIPIPHSLVKDIKLYRKLYPAQIDNRLFCRKVAGHISVIVKKYTGHGIHCLRHTYATRLLASGTDIKTVAALLGDTVGTVINTYVSYTDDMREKARNDIQRLFG